MEGAYSMKSRSYFKKEVVHTNMKEYHRVYIVRWGALNEHYYRISLALHPFNCNKLPCPSMTGISNGNDELLDGGDSILRMN